MDLWMKIGSALLLVAMLAMIWPRAKVMMSEGPKGSSSDWRSLLLPLLAVVGFVALLIMAV